MDNRLLSRVASPDVNYRLLIPLLINTGVVQLAIMMIRVTASYRAIELGLPAIWLGVITSSYAVLPLMLAVSVGRFIDRGHDALSTWIGGSLMMVAAAGFVVWSSLIGLIVCMAMLGVSQMFLIAGQQIVCMRAVPPSRYEQVFGQYMVSNAIGQGLGPYVVGWVGGGATVPPTHLLFILGLAAAVIAAAFAYLIRPQAKEPHETSSAEPIPIGDLVRVPGLLFMVSLGVISVSSQDLTIVYLPLLGSERHIEVGSIGLLLTIRAIASMVSRFLYARIVIATGRTRMMLASSAAAAAAFATLVLPVPVAALAVAIAVIGFAVGLTTTLSITGLVVLVAPGARATANSLRMVGNRIGQLIFPFAAGAIAAAVGAGGIFALVAVGFAASSAVQVRQRSSGTAET